jgi:hypothetical protein
MGTTHEVAAVAATRARAVLAVLAFAAAPIASAAGGEGMGMLFGGGMGGPPFRLRLEGHYSLSSDAKVVGQGTDLGLVRYGVSLAARPFTTERDSLTLSVSDSILAIDTAATLPATGTPVPDEFQRIRLGLAWARRLDMGRSVTAAVNVGSASDDPFGGDDRPAFSWVMSYVRPTEPGKAWIFAAFMTNTFEELNYVPIPMVAYMSRGERHTAVVGLPFAYVNWRPRERWAFDLSYFPVTNVRAKATYRPRR